MEVEYHLVGKHDVKFTTFLDKQNAMTTYKHLLSLRTLEEYLQVKFREGKIRGFCHLVVGQENIYISLQKVLSKEDKVIGSYRCHGLAYACGISIESIIAETFGKSNGNCKGKGGSMHLYNEQFYGGHGIVGAQVALGTGIAFAQKYKKQKNVCFVFYGDGASNQGQVFESFNMAMLWNLPVVYVCENNMYGMWTPDGNVCSYTKYYKRGINIPGIRISDNDIAKLADVFIFAKNHAITKGPIIIQIDTYRTCGHSCNDKYDFYRSADEKKEKMQQDCIKHFKKQLQSFVGSYEIAKLETEVLEEFRTSVEKSVFAKDPDSSELFTDVYK